MIVLTLEQEIATQKAIERLGVFGGSIFTKTEALLLSGKDDRFSLALTHVVEPRVTACYTSMVDLLFCELHPEYKPGYEEFSANDDGVRLVSALTLQEIEEFDNRLVVALYTAVEWRSRNLPRDWEKFRRDVEEAVKLASHLPS